MQKTIQDPGLLEEVSQMVTEVTFYLPMSYPVAKTNGVVVANHCIPSSHQKDSLQPCSRWEVGEEKN